MFNLQRRKFLFSYAIIPLVISNYCIAPVTESPHLVAQNAFKAWIRSFWQRRPSHRLGARSGICPIAPGLIETYVVWHDRPLFVWLGEGTQIRVRDRESQAVLWTQSLKTTERQIAYSGKEPLQPGKLYQWQLLGIESLSSDRNHWTTFKVMPTSDRDKIKADLQTLEQKLRATGADQEEIGLKKADYFLNYKIKHEIDKNEELNAWSDALQTLYEVENPSPSFIEQRQAYVANFCTQPTATTRVN